MAKPPWNFRGKGVLRELRKQPKAVRKSAMELIERLATDPTNPSNGARPLKPEVRLDGETRFYFARFEGGQIVYAATKRHPVFDLLMVVFEGSLPESDK